MKRCILIILVLLIACSFATADDYIKINLMDGGEVYVNDNYDLDFYLTYECSDPNPMDGLSLGFVITTTGSAIFSHTAGDYTKYHDTDWFNVGGLVIDDSQITGTYINEGTILFTGAYSSSLTGDGLIPPVTDELFATIGIRIGYQFGDDFCIDSGFVEPSGTWEFTNMTCGEGGAADRPLFLDADGQDVHPICVTLVELGPDPIIDTVPDGDLLSVNHCYGTSFQFGANPNCSPGLDPGIISYWNVFYGPGSIDDTGYYTIDAQLIGTYDVTIEAFNNCGGRDVYDFQVEFTNNAPSFVDCPVEYTTIIDYFTSVQLYADEPDMCDQLGFYLVDDGGQTGVSVTTGGMFSWNPTPSTTGTYTFVAGVVDGVDSDECTINITLIDDSTIPCGDVDGTGFVDIDDVVYLMNYIFQGGPAPVVPYGGNVDCSRSTDIDDVVYLIEYLFQSGNYPCDPDGNGVPDC